ncbi:MAG: hypothetical protein HKN26_01820 [Acidimicrobiales bacterium]|nr:hypothetical protein [Acidimicrobiales bacterium]
MTTRSRWRLWSAVALPLLLAASACSSDDAETGTATTVSSTAVAAPSESITPATTAAPTTTAEVPLVAPATITGPIISDNGPVQPQPAVPLPEGYTEDEFFLAGDAARYEVAGERGADGFWDAAVADTAAYQTRILVRRPPAAVFSGVVIVEWLNVSATESSPDWGYLIEEIAEQGHAYVAVSAQSLGVIGGESILSVEVDEEAAAEAGTATEPANEGGLVNTDPERYGTLNHPGDAYAYDIFDHVGASLIADPATLLDGLEPVTVLALGESQSAGFLTTYLNAVHPLTDTYDAFLVHSRGAGGAPLDGSFGRASDDEEEPDTSFVSEGQLIRADLNVPVFIVQAETDLTLLGYSLARQPDSDLVHTWELAGTAHADAHVIRAIVGGPRDPSVGSFLSCEGLINAGPHHEGVSAALRHLVTWTQTGQRPPSGDRLELTDTDPVAIARDDLGRALGGVRNPLVDVPVLITTGDPASGIAEITEDFGVCDLFGTSIPLDAAALLELHGSADDYITAFEASTEAAVEAGFLLPTDADQLRAEAEENRALFG